MKASVTRRYGSADEVKIEERPVPVPGPGEVYTQFNNLITEHYEEREKVKKKYARHGSDTLCPFAIAEKKKNTRK